MSSLKASIIVPARNESAFINILVPPTDITLDTTEGYDVVLESPLEAK